MLDICIVGFGALGVLYGFVLERSGNARVTAVCRSNYKIVKEQGVHIHSERYGDFKAWKPFRAVSSTDEAADQSYDYVICTAKFIPDLISTADILGPLLERTNAFFLIQNGIGVESGLRGVVAAEATIISACAWVDATAIDGGALLTHGRLDRLVIGIHPPSQEQASSLDAQDKLNTLAKLLEEGGCEIVITEDIRLARWEKNLWNISLSIFCTLSRTTVGTVMSKRWIDITTPCIIGAMKEAVEVARMMGIQISDGAIDYAYKETWKEHSEAYAEAANPPFIPVQFKPSMFVDLEAGRPLELEGIIGTIVKIAKELGVAVPRLESSYSMLAIIQEELLRNAGARGVKEVKD